MLASKPAARCLIGAMVFTAFCAKEKPASTGPATADSHFREKRECMETGWRFVDETTRVYAVENARMVRPVFKYNAKLDTCICKFAVRSANGGLELWVYDILTNRDLAAYLIGPDGKQLSEMSKAEFDTKELELMGENLP